MFFEYVVLIWLLVVLVVLVYIFFYIHDIPYEVAKHRNHPQADAIYAGCWLSLFTLHAIWPFIFIWALMKSGPSVEQKSDAPAPDDIEGLKKQIASLNERLALLQKGQKKGSKP